LSDRLHRGRHRRQSDQKLLHHFGSTLYTCVFMSQINRAPTERVQQVGSLRRAC
jgi:hypothetical protein